ncbi:phosphoheptose isomerase [Biformimicrobium ophioploci]|uniref:Phosphoheptose isomerase n=2 Tax=Biformimicrobium ophioploci TaxID=3036711 RepID=A0ABQ6LX31_9GAMM|nr:phosphoheptose isomerase [Microbulbifer sp. NKW57]
MNAGEFLAPLIAEASEMLVHTLLSENKVLACGNGVSGAVAQTLVTNLVSGFQRERPSLPALAINADSALGTAIAQNHGGAQTYAKPVHALGQPGDLLVIFSSDGRDSNLVQAVRAARDREMSVLAFTGADGGDCAALLDNHDIELRVPEVDPAAVHQVHMLTVFTLCDLVDSSLFGSYEE